MCSVDTARNERIARSIWGNGHGTDKAPFNDQGEAVQALFQLLAPPAIDTSTEWIHSLENTFIPKPWEKTNRSTIVALPNWQPSQSHYSITQQTLGYAALHFSNRPAEQEDGAKELKIELDGKIGKVQFESHYEGTIEVTYWPYGATDGDFSLTASND